MKYQNHVILLAIMFLLSSCSAVQPTIHSNLNPAVDIKQYKTFGFFQPLDTDTRYESLFSQYLKAATVDEMTKRGFVFSKDKPDLLINFHNTKIKKQDIQQIPIIGYGGFSNFYGPYYYDWPVDRTFINNYQQNILKIDVVDRQKNKVIWQGVAIKREYSDNVDNLQGTVPKIVANIFQQFPVAIDISK